MVYIVQQLQSKQIAVDAHKDANIKMSQADSAVEAIKVQSETTKMISDNYKKNMKYIDIDNAVRVAERAEKNNIKEEEIKQTSAFITDIVTDVSARKNAEKSVRDMIAQNVPEEEFQRWSAETAPKNKQSSEDKKKAVADLLDILK